MHPPRLTHVRAVALVVVTFGVLAGCTNPFADDARVLTPVDPNQSSRMLTQGQTESMLPSGASLPEGWSPAPKNLMRPTPDRDVVSPARCDTLLHAVDAPFLRANAKSYTTYASISGSYLGVGIASLPSTRGGFARFRDDLRACPSFTVVANGKTTQVSAKPLRIPSVTEDDLRVRFRISSAGEQVTYELVRAQIGHNVLLVDMLSPGSRDIDTAPLQTMEEHALSNLGF